MFETSDLRQVFGAPLSKSRWTKSPILNSPALLSLFKVTSGPEMFPRHFDLFLLWDLLFLFGFEPQPPILNTNFTNPVNIGTILHKPCQPNWKNAGTGSIIFLGIKIPVCHFKDQIIYFIQTIRYGSISRWLSVNKIHPLRNHPPLNKKQKIKTWRNLSI